MVLALRVLLFVVVVCCVAVPVVLFEPLFTEVLSVGLVAAGWAVLLLTVVFSDALLSVGWAVLLLTVELSFVLVAVDWEALLLSWEALVVVLLLVEVDCVSLSVPTVAVDSRLVPLVDVAELCGVPVLTVPPLVPSVEVAARVLRGAEGLPDVLCM